MPSGRALAWRAFMLLFYAVLAVSLVYAAYRAAVDLREADRIASWLGAVLILLVVQLAAVAAGWGTIYERVARRRPSRRLLLRSFVIGWLWRYLPGPPGGPAGKLMVCLREGEPLSTVGAALFYENVLQLIAGAMVPAMTLAFVTDQTGLAVAGSTAAAAAAVGLTLVAGRSEWLRAIARRLHRLTTRIDPEAVHWPPSRELVVPLLLLVSGAFLGAIAFHVVAIGVSDWPEERVGQSVFIFGIGAFAGWAIPFAPSGLGVRDGIIVALMAPVIGTTDAVAVALASRAANVLADGLLGAFALAAYSAAAARSRAWFRPPATALNAPLAAMGDVIPAHPVTDAPPIER